ncbi:hypothetical protein GGQ60_001662 [Pedobacter zeae]|uniref:Uncharacterized protein n=1 Tax=Pedobacter zeae TaxID=1737356 RepID=A0A7W6K9G6_9SPHI|nr:hypothetical protein [Pedobacter zeae]
MPLILVAFPVKSDHYATIVALVILKTKTMAFMPVKCTKFEGFRLVPFVQPF